MWNSTKILGRNPNAFILWNSKLHATRLNLENVSVIQPKPFEEIPSPPKSWIPFFGHGVLLVKKPAGMEQMWKNIAELKAKYVPPGVELLRLHMPVLNTDGGGRVLHLFDVDDIKEVYRNEGKYPKRVEMSFFRVLRERRPDIFGQTAGIFLADGEEWQKLRTKVNQDMMRPKSAYFYIDKLQKVGDDFVSYIRQNRNKETQVVEHFVPFAQKFVLEAITLITLDARMGCLDKNPPPELERVIRASDTLVTNFPKFMSSVPVWNYVPPRWSKLFREVEDSFTVAADYISTKINEAAERCEKNVNFDPEQASVLEKLIIKNGSKSGIPTVMALDALFAGIDTTGNSLSFLLYLLAKNPEKQEKLREEINSFGHQKLTTQDIANMKYFKACQQESFRVLPTTNGNLRVLPHDVTIRGYNVPAGTAVFWSTMLTAKNSDMFPDPEKFIPERWIEQKDEIHPFASRPFGHGPRMCIGKRFAELEIQLGIAKLLQNFRVEWAADYEEIEAIAKMVNCPDKPLKFKFVDL